MNYAVIIFIIFAVALAGLSVHFIKDYKNATEYPENEEDYESETESTGARIISKRTDIVQTGSYKSPSHELLYLLTLVKDNGETEEISVTKEMFEKYCVGKSGILIKVDGEFFDFGDGEEITE